MSKLNLDRDKILACREMAGRITERVYRNIVNVTTDSIERASLRLLGIEDAYNGTPVVNLILESIPQSERGRGICHWFGRGLATQRSSPIALALRVAGGKVNLTELPEASEGEISRALAPLIRKSIDRLHGAAKRKADVEKQWPSRARPLKSINVGTGDIRQDVIQGTAAARAGADCVGMVRSSGQSLMGYVPHGETFEGNEGTYVTQSNLRIMRETLDGVSREEERYIRLMATASGLCMPEIATIASFENVDYLLSDALYGILFRNIHSKRAFVDQEFTRLILAHSGVIIHTCEDQYLACAESYRVFPQALASLFMNEQFSFLNRLREWQMGFSHAYEIDPEVEDGFLYEVAQAQMVRECFPKAPIIYRPPTRHKTGDIFLSHIMDGLFTMVGAMTHQDLQELGAATEAIHHPLMMDRHWALKAAKYVFGNTRSLGDEIQWSANGKVVRRARSVLDAAYRLLQKIEKSGGLIRAISKGAFANVIRQQDEGLGQDGLIEKGDDYFNPVWKALKNEEVMDLSIIPASHRRYASYRSPAQERGGRPSRSGRSEAQGRGRYGAASRAPSNRRGSRFTETRGRRRSDVSYSHRGRAAEEPAIKETIETPPSEEATETSRGEIQEVPEKEILKVKGELEIQEEIESEIQEEALDEMEEIELVEEPIEGIEEESEIEEIEYDIDAVPEELETAEDEARSGSEEEEEKS